MGAFLTHGVQPGPLLMKEHPEIFWGVITSMYVGNAILLILNLPLIGLWVQLLKVPYRLLFPLILLFCMIGVYSVSSNMWDMVIMLIFGIVGYLMKKFDYEPAPLVLCLSSAGWRRNRSTISGALARQLDDLSYSASGAGVSGNGNRGGAAPVCYS